MPVLTENACGEREREEGGGKREEGEALSEEGGEGRREERGRRETEITTKWEGILPIWLSFICLRPPFSCVPLSSFLS